MPRGKTPKTIVKTGVTTGTAVSLLFLSASAAFAAMAITKPAFKPRVIRPINLEEKQWVDPQQTAGQGAAKIPAGRLPSTQNPTEPGRISMVLDGDSPLARIIVAGTNDVPMLKVRFTANGEAFIVRKLRVFNDNVADDNGISQVKVTYPTQSGAMETKTGVLSRAVAEFSGLNMYVPANNTAVLAVAADLAQINSVDVSGDTPTFGVDWDSNFEAQGQGSGVTITSSGSADVVGNMMVIRKTKPTVTLASTSPSGAAVPGLNEVLRFTVAADAASGLVLQAVSFKVSSTDNANTRWNAADSSVGKMIKTSGWSLYSVDDMSTQLETGDFDWTLYGAAPGDGVLNSGERVGYARLYFSNPPIIAAGASKTFVLKVDTTGASSVSDDTIRFDVLDENGADNVTLKAMEEFMWAEAWQSVPGAQNIGGFYVRNLPVNGGTNIY